MMTNSTVKANRPSTLSISIFSVLMMLMLGGIHHAQAQWATSGNDINSTNSGNVGVGTSSPAYKLDIMSSINVIARFGSSASGSTEVLIGAQNGYNSSMSFQHAGTTKWSLGNRASNHRFGIVESTGTEVFTILQNGYVGIGTTTPNQVLSTYTDTSGTNRFLNILSTTGTGSLIIQGASQASINMVTANGQADKRWIQLATDNGKAYFRSINDNATNIPFNFLYMDLANGNVGVNTTAPAYKFEVQGGQINSSGGLCIAGDCKTAWSQVGGGSGSSQWITSGSSIHYDSGNVGVGTTTPGFKFDLQGGQLNASGGLCIAGDCKTAWSQVGGGGSSQWTTSGSTIYYNSGNVGIGTGTPSLSLDVQKAGANGAIRSVNETSGVRGFIAEQRSTNAVGAIFVGLKSRGTLAAPSAVTNGDYGAFLSGQWYDGTSNVQSGAVGLVVDGTVSTNVVPTRLVFVTSATSGDGSTAHGVERMTILSGGNVGIGTTNPQSRLQVGTQTSLATASPESLSLGGTFSNGAAQHLKLKTYDDGTYIYGIGVSALQQEYVVPLQANKHVFYAGNSPLMTIQGTGEVGIGTSSPTAKLHVVGNGLVTGNLTVDGNIAAKYQDVAEWVDSSEVLLPGTVVVLDHTKSNQVIASFKSYDTSVAGVISTQPGIALGESGEGRVLVATTGRVKVRVDATNGPIQIGDLLVTGEREGVAIKSQPINISGVQIHRPGTLIGKALEPLAKGSGEILVLLSLQ